MAGLKMQKAANKTAVKAAVEDVEIDRRAIEATDALGIPTQMRKAALELAMTWNYEDAAEKAETTPEIVREWTQDPDFVMAVGWCVIGLADNP
jgi:hypothetical protein